MRLVCVAAVAALLGWPQVAGAAAAITDDDVTRAIEKAREWLVNKNQNGSWPSRHDDEYPGGTSDMVLFTLAYIGEKPDRPAMAAAIDAVIARRSDKVYVRSFRAMAMAAIQSRMGGPRRDMVRLALAADAQWLIDAQGSHGGWDYESLHGRDGRFDFSNTQLAILALWQASAAGIEVPPSVWTRAQKLYYSKQQADGSWNYGDPNNKDIGGDTPGYGSMTAAGLASIYICADMLDLASGCPCHDGKSGGDKTELNRRLDIALAWLGKNFAVDRNPNKEGGSWLYYWLYAAERVGIAAGYKYFGTHNWFKEGATYLVGRQGRDGSWQGGDVAETCFATLFLYKGRAPVLFEKLQVPYAEWNDHRRDIANLTAYIEKNKEQPFHWQIVSLKAPVEELHDAPVLYLSLETTTSFSAEEKKKLREFTDTGGTILFEASCGAPPVKDWFARLAKELWPEWSVKPLGPDHATFLDPYPLRQRPEILGIHDGVRTCVFYARDDISCAWQTRAVTAREYVFKWGVNLFTYATDHTPLRAKLASREPPKSDRYKSVVKAGLKNALSIVRLKSDGDWQTNRNYKGFEQIVAEMAKRAEVRLKVDEDGTTATALADQDAAYLTGSHEVTLAEPQRQALRAYLAKGGFLWAEAATGSEAFDKSFRKLAADMGWELKEFDKTSPPMTGALHRAVGYDLSKGVQFRPALRMARLGRPSAWLLGIYQDGLLVGVYSPLDIVFSVTPYDAYGCRGYQSEDAAAVAANIILMMTDR